MSDEATTFPSITFPATFEGTAAIGADFSATMKFKTSNGPKVLEDLKALPRGTYDLTIVSRQAALTGDSIDREWAEVTLLDGDCSELVYEKTCLGARCPVFAVHSSGEFEGRYVCEDGADTETYMEVVHGETRCPRHGGGLDEQAAGAEDEDYDDAVGEAELGNDQPAGSGDGPEPHVSVVIVLYPGDDEPHVTKIGEHTRYSELVADYLTLQGLNAKESGAKVSDYDVAAEDTGEQRVLSSTINPDDYGKRLVVSAA